MEVQKVDCPSCKATGLYDGEACPWCKGGGQIPRRMDGYYIGFEPTGNFAIDKILGAVACAGKASHHTDGWNEESRPYDDHSGRDPNEWIQNAANEAAALLKTNAT